MADDLNPIGATLQMATEPDVACSRRVWRVFHYRVVAHDLVAGSPSGPGHLAERLECIKVDEYPTLEYLQLGSHLMPVPPPDIRHMFVGWDRFVEGA